jgi:hypothetical protein
MEVTVELFGIPRQRAGAAQVMVNADTFVDALQQLETACPKLAGVLAPDGTLSPRYLLSLDGKQFVGNLRQRIPPNARILLLSADAGG